MEKWKVQIFYPNEEQRKYGMGTIISVMDNENNTICCWSSVSESMFKEIKERANLIASAHELLNALGDLINCPAFSGTLFTTDHASHKAWTLARAAFEKAIS